MKLSKSLAALAFVLTGVSGASAAVIDLGFSLDESGSVSRTNFETTRNALADALAQIPTSGTDQYRLAVTTFSSRQTTVVPPTIVTAQNISDLQDDVRATLYSGGNTDTAGAINTLVRLFQNDGSGLGDTTILNITTDGRPNSQSAAENAALAAFNAGVDGLSFEGIGLNTTTQNNMLRISSLGTTGLLGNAVLVTDLDNLPNVTTTGFLVDVSDFGAYSAAIDAKIGQVIIDTTDPNVVPLPAGLPLLLAGLGAFGVIRRKQKS